RRLVVVASLLGPGAWAVVPATTPGTVPGVVRASVVRRRVAGVVVPVPLVGPSVGSVVRRADTESPFRVSAGRGCRSLLPAAEAKLKEQVQVGLGVVPVAVLAAVGLLQGADADQAAVAVGQAADQFDQAADPLLLAALAEQLVDPLGLAGQQLDHRDAG